MAISTVFIVATFHRYSQQFQQKLCLPADEWWRDEHTLQQQNVLSAPPLLSPWCALWCSALCRMCTARFPVWLQQSPPCAHVQPSRTRMGETAARRSKRQEGSSPDNLFQETMVGQPSTWPPVSTHLSSQVAGFAKSFGQQRLQVVGRPDCSGVSPFWRLGPEMVGRWVLARPHTAFTNHRSHTSLDRRWPGGEEGAWVGPKMQTGQSQVLDISCHCGQSGLCWVIDAAMCAEAAVSSPICRL